jgi:hypothetical protein
MAKGSKELSHKNPKFASGGKTKMFTEGSSSPQKPAFSGGKGQGQGKGGAKNLMKGGKTHMFGFAPSVPATAGKSSAR